MKLEIRYLFSIRNAHYTLILFLKKKIICAYIVIVISELSLSLSRRLG